MEATLRRLVMFYNLRLVKAHSEIIILLVSVFGLCVTSAHAIIGWVSHPPGHLFSSVAYPVYFVYS